MAIRRRGVRLLVVAISGSLCLGAALLAQSTAADEPAGSVVGSKTSKTFHRPSCAAAKRLTSKNKVEFADVDAAKAEGYKPCALCKPETGASDSKTGSK